MNLCHRATDAASLCFPLKTSAANTNSEYLTFTDSSWVVLLSYIILCPVVRWRCRSILSALWSHWALIMSDYVEVWEFVHYGCNSFSKLVYTALLVGKQWKASVGDGQWYTIHAILCHCSLLYEVFPMSFLMEQAGGQAFTGKGRVSDIFLVAILSCYFA